LFYLLDIFLAIAWPKITYPYLVHSKAFSFPISVDYLVMIADAVPFLFEAEGWFVVGYSSY